MSGSLQLYNSLGQEKQEFVPGDQDCVRMYVCGVTVYDDCHVGHGRVYVIFDAVRRFFEHSGYNVKYVVNFTDVDDKIIDRAEEMGRTTDELSQTYTQAYFDVMDKLNVLRADVHPTVTSHLPEIIEHIRGLVEKDVAYEVDGNVYFEVRKFDEYGKLSGQDPDEMESGSRIDVDERKKSPLDFALWKRSVDGEPAWDSPWGQGRPGWHIECSVMSRAHLGDTLDIHGGGRDLIFPHHENEIAQTEALTGKPFSRYWMHNGFVTIDDEKMSKSEGNFYTLKEVFEEFDPRVLRYFYLTRHYRRPLNFSFNRLEEAGKALSRLDDFGERLREAEGWSTGARQYDSDPPSLEAVRGNVLEAMRDDFNTARAIGHLQEWMSQWNARLDEWARQESLDASQQTAITAARSWLEEIVEGVLGIRFGPAVADRSAQASGAVQTGPATVSGRLTTPSSAKGDGSTGNEQDGNLEPGEDLDLRLARHLKEFRDRYREDGNYEVADRIRELVEALGWGIEDSPKGSRLVSLGE